MRCLSFQEYLAYTSIRKGKKTYEMMMDERYKEAYLAYCRRHHLIDNYGDVLREYREKKIQK